MSILPAEYDWYLSSNNVIGTYKGAPNNDVDTSLGGQLSSTPLSDSKGNLYKKLTALQLAGPVDIYRCIGVELDNAVDQLDLAHLMSENFSSLPAGASVEFAIHTNDKLDTPCPVCADENTPPIGLTFFPPFASTGDADADDPSAEPIGPLNAPGDGVTELTFDDSVVMFLYIKLTLNGVTASINSTDLGYLFSGDESLV